VALPREMGVAHAKDGGGAPAKRDDAPVCGVT
jgi:hypothetical protein